MYDAYEQKIKRSDAQNNIQILIDNRGHDDCHRLETEVQKREEEIKEMVRHSEISQLKKKLTESLDMKVKITVSGDKNIIKFSRE